MDFIVNPPVTNCGDSGSSSGGTTVTSGLTYDGGTLNCLGISYNTNLNTSWSILNNYLCELNAFIKLTSSEVDDNTEAISALQQDISNFNSSSFDISGIDWVCITPTTTSLNDALIAIETAVCNLQTSLGSCPDDGAGSGNVVDYYRPLYAHGFVHDLTQKFGINLLSLNGAAGQFEVYGGTTTDPTGCTKVSNGSTLYISASDANKDIYLRHSYSSGFIMELVSSGDPEPALPVDQVRLHKLSSSGTLNISYVEDHREYSPYDESIFRSTTNLSAYTTPLDLSAPILYDSVVTIVDAKTLVHKDYVDNAISASITNTIWTETTNEIYYNSKPVGIGTSTPANTVSAHINGTLRYTDGSELQDRYLKCDSNGDATWSDLDLSLDVSDESTSVGAFTAFNFIGNGVSATDAGNGVLDITITGTVAMLNDLSDVSAASPVNTNTLVYDGASWINSSVLSVGGTQVSIGTPSTIDASLHIKSTSGLALKIETTAGTVAEIDSTGELDYKKAFKYTYTNGGANSIGAGKVLVSDANGVGLWETFTSISGSGQSGRAPRWTGTNTVSTGALYDDGSAISINEVTMPDVSFLIANTASQSTGLVIVDALAASSNVDYYRGLYVAVGGGGNDRNFGSIASAQNATEMNIAVLGETEQSGSNVVTGVVGIAHNVSTLDDDLDVVFDAMGALGMSSTGILGLAKDGHQNAITAFVDEDSFQLSQAAYYGKFKYSGANTKDHAIVYTSQGVAEEGTGDITNAYHLFLAAHSGSITNTYGIFQDSSSDINYFAGKVGINVADSTSVVNPLEVLGTTLMEGNLKIKGNVDGKLDFINGYNTTTSTEEHNNYMNWYLSDGTTRKGYLGFTDENTFKINVLQATGNSQIVLEADELLLNTLNSGTSGTNITFKIEGSDGDFSEITNNAFLQSRESGGDANFVLKTYGVASVGSEIECYKYRGDSSAIVKLQNGDLIASTKHKGYVGSNLIPDTSLLIETRAAQDFNDSQFTGRSQGVYYTIDTRSTGIDAPLTERFKIDGDGAIVFNGQYKFPTTIGSLGQSLTVGMSGQLAWSTISAGISDLIDDTTPQLGGTLDANGNTIDMGANTITDTKVGQWDTAYGWGDHAPLTANIGTNNIPYWNGTAFADSNILRDSTDNHIKINQQYANPSSTGNYDALNVISSINTAQTSTGKNFSTIVANFGGFLIDTAQSYNAASSIKAFGRVEEDIDKFLMIRTHQLVVDPNVTLGTTAHLYIGSTVLESGASVTNKYGILQEGVDQNKFSGEIYTTKNIKLDGQIYNNNGMYNAGTGSSASFDMHDGNVQKWTITSTTTAVANPTNAKDGAVYTICFINTGSKNVTVWGNQFNWGDAGAPDFSGGANTKKHYVTLVRNGSIFDAIYSGVIH